MRFWFTWNYCLVFKDKCLPKLRSLQFIWDYFPRKFEQLPSFYLAAVCHPSILILYQTNNYNRTEFQGDKASLPAIAVSVLHSPEKWGCLVIHWMATSGPLPPHLPVLPKTSLRFPLQHLPEASHWSHSIFLSYIHSVQSTIKTQRTDRGWKLSTDFF